MDESICLDDDSALTQGVEKPVLASPDTTPSLCPNAIPVTEDSEAAADAETARILAQAKSMENILLETSPIMDVPSDVSVSLASDPVPDTEPSQMTIPAEATVSGAQTNSGPLDAVPSPAISPGQEQSMQCMEVNQEKAPQLSNYFGTTDQGPGEPSSFFDQISSGTGGQSPQEENIAYTEDSPTQLPPQGQVIRERTLSVASEEATPVSFEEVKGSGLKFIGSMESVTKFFNETTGTGQDTEGKEFFDSFTAGATGDLAAQPPAAIENLAEPVSPPVAVPGSSLPPETPPIPHEPMSMSPLPSPIHTSFMRPRSISQSQASPAPSPIHTVLAMGVAPTEPEETMDPGLKAAFPIGDDQFTAGLAMSDTDRRQDAWMPNETTRQALVAIVTTMPDTYTVDTEQLTVASIIPSDPLGDPVQELVQRFMGEAEANKRITLTIDDVTEDAEGLHKLISAECWRSAADLTGKLLDAHIQGKGILGQPSQHTAQSLQMWFCRMALLVKLRLYTHAETECQAFGNLDKPDLYYEFYPDLYPGRRGSMVPFAFRILHAELPQYLGKSQESLDRLYYVHAITQKILSNLESGLAEDGSMIELSDESRQASHDLWTFREVQLQYAIGNCLLRNKDYSMAIDIFEGLLKSDEHAKEEHVLCGIGRIYLQMGDVKTAQHYFTKAETASDTTKAEVKCRNLMNKGFVALGQNLFSEAYNYFKQATTLNPTNAVAVNNMAVCSLYMGKLRDALTTLESLVHQDPARCLQEGILFNLCTLYELESSRALHKKQALLQLVSKHKGNGFNTACLKMT